MENLNTYTKFCPNVFVAKCPEQHEKGEEIILTTKYGKEHESIVHNFLGKKGDFFLYSITRADGFNHQERARKKAERLTGYASNAEKRSTAAYEASREGEDFLRLAEPIKIGHHSEKRHRALIDRNWKRMEKCVNESDKAADYAARAEYWEKRTNDINLSMPESLEYFEFKLEEATEKHKYLKANPDKREHGFSLTYAKKEVNEVQKKLKIAVRLWGETEAIEEVQKEEEKKAEVKKTKAEKYDDTYNKYGGFYAFSTAQAKEGIARIKESGHLLEGEKVTHIAHGLYLPSKNVDAFLKEI